MPAPVHHIVWFRRDLRIGDNPTWSAATQQADIVTALFVVDDRLFERAGPFRRDLLIAHLHGLDEAIRHVGGRLRVERGDPTVIVPRLVDGLAAERVHWNADTTPYASTRDHQVREAVGERAATYWGTLVHEPGRVLTGKGTLSKVFTPFYKAWDRTEMRSWPLGHGSATIADAPGDGIPDAAGAAVHAGGEAAARGRLDEFLARVDDYLDLRDTPSVNGTSELSSDLRFGTLSPREVAAEVGDSTKSRRGFVRQLAWRDWYAHLLYENPTMPDAAIKPAYDAIEWIDDDDSFDAWKQGHTGYPIVDAGMRQLLATGWMHNRVRMIVGSFLVKDLLIDWRRGERWFRHLLIDADVAQNVGNWQWVAGCGTDAAPYFRVFNPWLQSKKFDGSGDYIRRWVPELAGLGGKHIHEPAAAAPLELAAAGVIMGDTYPFPLVDHAVARDRALAHYKSALG